MNVIHVLMQFLFDRSEDELDWLVMWGRNYRLLNPTLQYNWDLCLRAIEADPEARKFFLKEHKNRQSLTEAHKRRLTKINS